ncbi:hypothetical protein LTR37_001912 [Vermiconidia calcicola]|uniref:Uncharacterized protein n=1 Tax=Vermiconidia calcicola TaxID=1690605 RepID=A0ACC3NWY1_9PEZI|nr:hypothetical protein LTR37_001912 [Vermiconidia calcicola]
MASEEEDSIVLNRPAAKKYEIAYQAHPEPSNRFGKLRDRPELDDVDPRYEPTVIKTNRSKAILDNQYLSTLAGEDWAPKRPLGGKTTFPSALDYHEAYKSGRLTPTQVAEALMPLIRRDIESATQHSIAFLSTRVDLVRKAAEESTARWRAGKPLSPLDGVPIAVKDEEDLTGYTKSLGSKFDFTSKTDATSYCVQKWIDAGAICLGKTTMHELGMDTTNNNPIFGTPRNPYDENYYCGGSSGGSAYSVGAGLIPFAMGNDGGGSIRIPTAYCGLYGLKTSSGRVSIRPSSNLAKSTGVAGPIAANMVDLELAYRVMAQPDNLNLESSQFMAPQSVQASRGGRKKVLGIYRTWFDRADAPVQKACWKALDYLTSQLGYEIVDISIPLVHEGQLAHAMTILAKVASGIPSTKEATAPNKVLISVGKQTPAVDFLQAQRLRNLLMQHLAHLYEHHPGMIIVTPTTPNAGWHIHPNDLKYGCSDANTQVRNMEYAWLANFAGCPAISVPAGYVDPVEGDGKVPIGLMGMSEWCCEDELIAFGYDAEKWLHEGLDGGRPRPQNFSDVLALAQARESS